jgi:hypothetical protein
LVSMSKRVLVSPLYQCRALDQRKRSIPRARTLTNRNQPNHRNPTRVLPSPLGPQAAGLGSLSVGPAGPDSPTARNRSSNVTTAR